MAAFVILRHRWWWGDSYSSHSVGRWEEQWHLETKRQKDQLRTCYSYKSATWNTPTIYKFSLKNILFIYQIYKVVYSHDRKNSYFFKQQQQKTHLVTCINTPSYCSAGVFVLIINFFLLFLSKERIAFTQEIKEIRIGAAVCLMKSNLEAARNFFVPSVSSKKGKRKIYQAHKLSYYLLGFNCQSFLLQYLRTC